MNYTNVCITDCKFCAFYRPPGHDEAYTLTLEQIESRVKTAWDMFGIRQVLIQGGHNADLPLEYYEDAFKMMRSKYPLVGIHGLSASELDIISKVEKSSTKEILSRLKDAGLQSVPGAGAEILVDSVKDVISPKKIKSADWLRIMREAHEIGLPSSATMMYGHVESDSDIATHFESSIIFVDAFFILLDSGMSSIMQTVHVFSKSILPNAKHFYTNMFDDFIL